MIIIKYMPHSYEQRTIKDLRILANERGYTNYSILNKEDLINLLRHVKPPCEKGRERNHISGRCMKSALIKKVEQSKKNLMMTMLREGKRVEKLYSSFDTKINEEKDKNIINKLKAEKKKILSEWTIQKKDARILGRKMDDELKRLNNKTNVINNLSYIKPLPSSIDTPNLDIKPIEPIGLPDSFMDIAEECSNNGFNRWIVDEHKDKIGVGITGTAYTGCLGENDCEYVVKVQPTGAREKWLRTHSDEYIEHDSYRHEMEALIDLQGWKHAPKLYAAWTCGDNAFFVMEKLEIYKSMKTLTTYRKVVAIMKELYKKKWIHTDVHLGNIMCRTNGDIVLIDYGRARKFKNRNDTKFADDHVWVVGRDEMSPQRMFDIQNENIGASFRDIDMFI